MLARTVLMARGRQGRGSQTGRARVCSFDGEGEKKNIVWPRNRDVNAPHLSFVVILGIGFLM